MKFKRIGAAALLGAMITTSPANLFAKKQPSVDVFGPWEVLTIVYSGVKTRLLAKRIKPLIDYYNIPAYLDSIPECARARIKLSIQMINALIGDDVDKDIEEIILKNLKEDKTLDLVTEFVYCWGGRNKLVRVAAYIKEKNNKIENDYLIYSLITNKYLDDTPENVKNILEYVTLVPKDYMPNGELVVAQVFDQKNWFEISIKSFERYASQFGKVEKTKKNDDGWEIVIITAGKLKMEFAYPKNVKNKRSYVQKAAKYASIIAYRGDIVYQEQFIMPEDINTGRKMIVWFGSCFSAPYVKRYKKVTGNNVKYIANIGTGYGMANIAGIKKLVSEIIKNTDVLLFSDLRLIDEMKKAVKNVIISFPSI